MPKLQNQIKLSTNLSIGVQYAKVLNTKTKKYEASKQGQWYARVKFPGIKNVAMRSCSVPYEEGSKTNQTQAEERAWSHFKILADKHTRGERLAGNILVTDAYRQYEKALEEMVAVNEAKKCLGLSPIYEIEGGRSYWSRDKQHADAIIAKNHLLGKRRYFNYLMGQYPNHHIRSIPARGWDTLDEWLRRNSQTLNVESRLHVVTCVRRFLNWCYKEEIIDVVPNIKRGNRGGVKGARERMRREIDVETYLEIVKYTREKFKSEYHPYRKDMKYLFHLWIMVLANCGIRPPTSGRENTIIRWEHVKLKGTKQHNNPVLLRPDEKGHEPYEAIILPNSVPYWEALKNFYAKKHGMPTKSGYVFAHWTRWGAHKKGDPIRNFKRQWHDMVKDLDLGRKGDPQSKRVSPSSLRAFFITQRLYADKQVNLGMLARSTGTSIGQIEARYMRVDWKKQYEMLAVNSFKRDEGQEPHYEDGYYIGHTRLYDPEKDGYLEE
jgi:hypothetical protein